MLFDDARDLALPEFSDGERAPRLGQQALPALEPRRVLSEGLAKKLAPRATLPPGDLVDLTREGCRDRDRYGALFRHIANVAKFRRPPELYQKAAGYLSGRTPKPSRSAASRRRPSKETTSAPPV